MKKKKLIDLILEQNMAPTPIMAEGLIMSGKVLVNNQKIDKAGTLVPSDAEIRLKKSSKSFYVSRGGDKLTGAMKAFNMACKNKVCLDIGLSTGGFSDVLLQSQAGWVFGVDVSYGILDLKIRDHPHMILLERTNARTLSKDQLIKAAEKKQLNPSICDQISLVVMDVSFISVKKILPQLKDLVTPNCDFIILIKPQFEAPKEWVGDGGIISDTNIIEKTLKLVSDSFKVGGECEGYELIKSCPSAITGTKGNQEYFFYLR